MKYPWDAKEITIMLSEENGLLEAEVFDSETFRISFRDVPMSGCPVGVTSVTVDDMSIDVARRLRDFLNYAVPE